MAKKIIKKAGPKVQINEIEMVKIGDLKEHPKNRNRHPEDQIERLAKIIEYQGWRYPIKVSKKTGFVTSGHGRLLAAKLRGWDEVPVSYQEYDSEEQEYADVQSDNAISLWSELDRSLINLDLEHLGPDFDIDLLGIQNFTLEVPIIETGKSTADRKLNYADSTFRQIILIMGPEDFEKSMKKMAALQEKYKVETNVEVFLKLLDEVEA